MTMMGIYLFDGGDLSKSLFRLVFVELDQCGNIMLYGIAHAFIVVLLPPPVKNNNHNNNPPQLTK